MRLLRRWSFAHSQAIVEKRALLGPRPPNVEMTGYNRSTSDMTRVAIVYASTPGTLFLDPLH
jgi:hypothetical protein